MEFAGYLREYIQSEDRRYLSPPPLPLPSPPTPPCRLSPSSESRLQLLYKRTVRNSPDPYKRTVYCVVGRCEVADSHTEVCAKTEDYMWLKVQSMAGQCG